MMRGSRWQIWLPRLLLCGVIVLAIQLGLGLVARSVIVRSVQTATGITLDAKYSKVEIGAGRVILGNLQFASSTEIPSSVATADVCDVELETQPLLHKQFIAKRGYLDGLQIDVPSAIPTDASQKGPATTHWFRDDADQVAAAWFSHVAERLQQDATRFESMKQTEAFLASWTSQCTEIDAHGHELDKLAAEVLESVAANQANPLRKVTFLTELPQRVAELQKKFAELRDQIEKQSDQLEQRRRSIVAARRHDVELANKPLTLDPVSADALTAYLLRSQATRPLDQLSVILQWARLTWPNTPSRLASGNRGEDILFAGCEARPSFLIRALNMHGTARIASQPIELRGVLTNLSNSPVNHGEPIRLRMLAAGSMPVELQATIDRTRGALRDSLLIDADGVLLPALKLGQPDQVAVTVQPSTASLSISLSAEGDKISGEIQVVQHDVHIAASTGNEFSKFALSQAMDDSLGKLNSLATRISLSGTIKEPKCTLWSNLGSAVAEAMRRAAERVGNERTRELLAEAARQEDEHLASAERHLNEQQARWNDKLASLSQQLEIVATAERPSDRLSPSRVGRRLPGNSLIR